ncbi:cell wall biogenesis protein [Peltigera leucophlebia]|nr:cell wall biogenesis protein [Peltigera leucophlebia]
MNGDYCSDLEVDKRYEIGYPIGQVHLGQVHLGQVHLGQVHLGQVHLGQVHLGQVHLGQVHLGQVHLISPYHEPEASGLQVASLAQPEKIAPKNTVHRTCGLRKSAFWLSLALVVVIVMGVTGISVAGCLAAKWKSEAKEKSNLQANVSSTSNVLAALSSSMRASSRRENSTSVIAVVTARSTSSIGNRDLTTRSAARSRTATTTYTVSTSANTTYPPSTLVQPTKASITFISSPPTDCPSLESPYTPPAAANSGQFDIACQTDFDLPHFLELTTKSFIECITECARHNLSQMAQLQGRCAVASFMASGFEGITCWLKSSDSPIQGRTTEKVSSAVARADKAK